MEIQWIIFLKKMENEILQAKKHITEISRKRLRREKLKHLLRKTTLKYRLMN